MKYLLFELEPGHKMRTIRSMLRKKGLKDIFLIEEEGKTYIGGHCEEKIAVDGAKLIEEKEAVVNWDEQWAQFAEDFHDHAAHIQVGDKTLLLAPGPGFGDLSHPTTFLVLEHLKEYAVNETIVDIGCGSGILTLAALLLGAKRAYGIDIDLSALEHARKNADLNQLSAEFSEEAPKDLGCVFLMNMISPEQKGFCPERFNRQAKLWITSGILASEEEAYLKQAALWNWRLVKKSQKSEWLSFVFQPG